MVKLHSTVYGLWSSIPYCKHKHHVLETGAQQDHQASIRFQPHSGHTLLRPRLRDATRVKTFQWGKHDHYFEGDETTYLGPFRGCLVLGGWNCGIQLEGQGKIRNEGDIMGISWDKIDVDLRGIIGICCNHHFCDVQTTNAEKPGNVT